VTSFDNFSSLYILFDTYFLLILNDFCVRGYKRYTRVWIVEHLIVLPYLLDFLSFYDWYHILGVINGGGDFITPNFLRTRVHLGIFPTVMTMSKSIGWILQHYYAD
jgi:hypothetical protein